MHNSPSAPDSPNRRLPGESTSVTWTPDTLARLIFRRNPDVARIAADAIELGDRSVRRLERATVLRMVVQTGFLRARSFRLKGVIPLSPHRVNSVSCFKDPPRVR
jgi:hypothetical protein